MIVIKAVKAPAAEAPVVEDEPTLIIHDASYEEAPVTEKAAEVVEEAAEVVETPTVEAPEAPVAEEAPAPVEETPVEETPAEDGAILSQLENAPERVSDVGTIVIGEPAKEPVAEAPVAEEAPAPVEEAPAPVEETPAPVEEIPAEKKSIAGMSINDPIRYVDDKIVEPRVAAPTEKESAEEFRRTKLVGTIIGGKTTKSAKAPSLITEDIKFYIDSRLMGNTAHIDDLVVAYKDIVDLGEIVDADGNVKERRTANIDLAKHKDINKVVIPKKEFQDILDVPGQVDLRFTMKDGYVEFDDEAIKSVVRNAAEDEVTFSLNTEGVRGLDKRITKALKSGSLEGISAFSCNINDSAKNFGAGNMTIAVPCDLENAKHLTLKYFDDNYNLSDEQFAKIEFVPAVKDTLGNIVAKAQLLCRVNHFSMFVIARDLVAAAKALLDGISESDAKVIDSKVISAPKAKGAYTITEETREIPAAPVAEAPVNDDVIDVVETPAPESPAPAEKVVEEAPEAVEAPAAPAEETPVEETPVEEAKAEEVIVEDIEPVVPETAPEAVEEHAKEEIVEEEKTEAPKTVAESPEIITKDYISTAKYEETSDLASVGSYAGYVITEHRGSELVIDGKAEKVEEIAPAAPVAQGTYTLIEDIRDLPAAPAEEAPVVAAPVEDGEPALMAVEFDGTIPETVELAESEVVEEAEAVEPVAEKIAGKVITIDESATKVIPASQAKEAPVEETLVAEEAPAVEEEAPRAEEIVTVLDDEPVVETRAAKKKAEKVSLGYVITETRREAPVDENRIVVEQNIPEEAPVAEETPVAEAPAVEEEILHTGEEIVTVVEDEPVMAAPKTESKYIITEQPDSAKRFEAAPATEVEKTGYKLSIDPTQAKKIDGTLERQYTITTNEKGKRTISAVTIGEKKIGVVEELVEDTKLIAAREVAEVEEAPVAEETKITEEILHEGEEIVTVLDDEPAVETPVEVKRELLEDKDGVKVISARPAPKKHAYTILEEKRTPEWKPSAKAPEKLLTEDEGVLVQDENVMVITPVTEKYQQPVEESAYAVLTSDREITEPEKAVSETEEMGTIVVTEAPKKTGGYKIVQQTREVPKVEKAPVEKAPVVEEILHTGEEIVTVVEDAPATVAETVREPVRKVVVEHAAKVISARAEVPKSEEPRQEMKVSNMSSIDAPEHVGEEFVSVIEEEPVVEAAVVAEAPKADGTYAISEQPNSAKRFEAKAPAEVKKSGYTLKIDESKTKVIESRDNQGYILKSHDDNAIIIESTIKSEPVAETIFTVGENAADMKIIDAAKVESEIVVLDEYTKTIEAAKEEVVSVVEEAPVEAPVEEVPEKKYTGYIITEDSNKTKVIAGRPVEPVEEEPAPAVEMIVSNISDSITAPEYVGEEIIRIVEDKTETVAEPVREPVRSVVIDESKTKVIGAKAEPEAPAAPMVVSNLATAIDAPEYSGEEIISVVEDKPETVAEPVAEPVRELVIDESKTKVIGAKEEAHGTIVIEPAAVLAPIAEPETPAEPAEKVLKTRPFTGYTITENYENTKVITGKTEEPAVEPVEAPAEVSEDVYIPEGIKILTAVKSKERYYLAESKTQPKKQSELEIITQFGNDEEELTGYNITERHDETHKVSAKRKAKESPLVYEEIDSEHIIDPKSYKKPERPLIYEEIGSEKVVVAEDGFESKVKDSVVEYSGTEEIIRGDMPIVDVLIDPYKANNMGVLTGRSLKRHLSMTQKEIDKLKFDLQYAKKKRDSFTKSAEKIVAHIAMVNNQCLICEYYIERVNVCTYSGASDLARKNSDLLAMEIRRYNKLLKEYNEMTHSNIPLADMSLTKRVLAGKAYEHLTRITYTYTNEQQPLKTKKGAINGKITQENRYLADIKLFARSDEEMENDLSVIKNRYRFETALLEGEKEILGYKFAKNSARANSRKAAINRRLARLHKAEKRALKYETMDNYRYYRVLTTDTNLAPYGENNFKKKRVNSVIYEVNNLLKKKEQLNEKLNAIYGGPLGDIPGVGESDKWREVKISAAKQHARKLKSKADALRRSVPGFGEEKSKRIFIFNSLLDAKVEALATIDLCKYRLKREKNGLIETIQIKRDMKEAMRKDKLIDKEIKERRKGILKEHYGPDASNDFIALAVIIGIIALGGVVLAYYLLGPETVLGYLSSIKDKLLQIAGPWIEKIKDMIFSRFN